MLGSLVAMAEGPTEITTSLRFELSGNMFSKKETMAEPHLCMWGNTREWKMGLRGPWEDAEAGN